jgi:PAS domain S-box-containing protein
MRLKQQVLLLIAVVLLVELAIFSFVSVTLMQESYASLEQEEVGRELERVEAVLENDLDEIEGVALDWGLWDETFYFARGEDPGYIERNLMEETFSNLGMDLFLIYAPDGTLQFAQGFNRSTGETGEVEAGLVSAITGSGIAATAATMETEVGGVLVFEGRPVLVAATRILTSTFEGPSPGTFVIGRILDEQKLARMIDMTGVPFTLTAGALPEGPGSERIADDGRSVLVPINATAVAGYARYGGLAGEELRLGIQLPRTIVTTGLQTTTTLTALIMVMSLLIGLAALVANNHVFLTRIGIIAGAVRETGTHPGAGRVPPLAGNDELSELGVSINRMLDAIQVYHARLAESEALFRTIIEVQGEVICLIGFDGTLLFVNPAFVRFFALENESAALGRTLDELLPAAIAVPLTEAVRSTSAEHPLVETEVEFEKDASPCWIAWEVRSIDDGSHELVGRDVTAQQSALAELRRYQDHLEDLVATRTNECMDMHERLAETQRLEAIGVLAGGIAHDFNNLLTAATGNLELARLDLPPGDPVGERLDELARELGRATGLTSQLLTFAQGGTPIKRTTRLKELVSDTAGFICRGSSVRCEFGAAEGLWSVDADPNQITQVVSNLVLNGIQAMGHRGTIEVSLGNVVLDGREGLPLPPGPYVVCEVRDHGPGIAAEVLPRIFDPFFTTKADGTGLGLATSYSIARRHSGYLTCESSPGTGAVFRLYLPAAVGRASLEDSGTGATPPAPPVNGSGIRVLIMDDEPAILEVTGAMLRGSGFLTEVARDGKEAVERYRAVMDEGQPFDLVIMDLTIPGGMGGREAMERLIAMDPGVRAIVSSGYSNDPIMADHATYGFVGVLAKPYRRNDLLAAVRWALDH